MAANNSDSDNGDVEIGEITIQYTAATPEAKAETEEFRAELSDLIGALSECNAVGEMSLLRGFNADLSWESSDDGTERVSEATREGLREANTR